MALSMTIYEAWASGWKFVVVSNRVWRLKVTKWGWSLYDRTQRSGYLTYPQAICEPIRTKWVQNRREKLARNTQS